MLVKQYKSRQDAQNRLIVNSNKIKESYGAVKVIKAHGFQVMQFKDYESAESAKSSIEKLGVACDRDDFAYTVLTALKAGDAHAAGRDGAVLFAGEIGRASCRERV